jgi:hypothetical protein
VRSLVWADTLNQNVKYGSATRYEVPTHGMIAMREFLRDYDLQLIVSGHQCVNGAE